MIWKKTAVGGWSAYVSATRTRYTLRRAPAFTPVRLWWVYVNGSRYTPTGHYDDAVSFLSAAEAKRFAEGLTRGLTAS